MQHNTFMVNNPKVQQYLDRWRVETFLAPPEDYGVRFVQRRLGGASIIEVVASSYEVALDRAIAHLDVHEAQEILENTEARLAEAREADPNGAQVVQLERQVKSVNNELDTLIATRKAVYNRTK